MRIECDVPAGLEPVALDEIQEGLAVPCTVASGRIVFDLPSDRIDRVRALRTVLNAWVVVRYEGRRPSVVLGDRRAVAAIRAIAERYPGTLVRLHAPGPGSAAMRRVRAFLTAGLREGPGGLQVRLRSHATGIRLLQSVLGVLSDVWTLERTVRVRQGGARPGVFVLRLR